MITINMEIAKEIKKQEIRYERIEKLKKLDVEFMKALEKKDEELQKDIKDKKQKLRDATDDPLIEEADSLESLKLIRPSILDIV